MRIEGKRSSSLFPVLCDGHPGWLSQDIVWGFAWDFAWVDPAALVRQ